ncbi:hypothetical protein BpHYR1_007976 [Brachionus plicatilis]|uniref:Uncharacterized protein n=1 Tax=Brachionus plicatilis TaxID=10195 RepID=A0A3M7RAA6_BRAPC|nr:hypothetical protein BpHYR1_007976 [Brachionus plicatilis]
MKYEGFLVGILNLEFRSKKSNSDSAVVLTCANLMTIAFSLFWFQTFFNYFHFFCRNKFIQDHSKC